jgi:hypothetical protein
VREDGRVFVKIPDLGNTYGPVIPLNTYLENKMSVNDPVMCSFTDEYFTNIVVLGTSKVKNISPGPTGPAGPTGPEGGSSTLTTKGDVLTRSASSVIRLGVGTNSHVLVADSNQTAGIKWGLVDESSIATSVAGSGLVGGTGSALSVNVDNLTIEIDDDALRIKDDGVTSAKIGVLTNTAAKTSDFTLALADKNSTILCNKTTDSAHTITIPVNSSIPFPIGTQISFVQIGSTQVVFGGAGVTLNSDNSKKKIMVRYGVASLIKTDTDTWVLFGQLTA